MRFITSSWKRFRQLPKRLTALERDVRRTRALMEAHRRETQQVLSYLMLPDPALWRRPSVASSGPGLDIFTGGALCRQELFEQPFFHFWCGRIGEEVRYHRKQWEFVFIAQAAWERGLLAPGRRALGFGVGTEPLSALFAAHGVKVTATDMAGDAVQSAGWQATAQHASGKDGLRHLGICPPDAFDRNVEFRNCDMNAVPADLTGYDFCWSACALEHLGSIEMGLSFIERSIDCLAPGGWAIHTTEFNLTSNEATIDNEITVLFRRQDIERVIERLRAQGHEAAAVDWTEGTGALDQYIDLPPYRSEPHLSAAIAGFKTTSLGLIVRKSSKT